MAEEGSDVLSPLVIALNDILHLEKTAGGVSTHSGMGGSVWQKQGLWNLQFKYVPATVCSV